MGVVASGSGVLASSMNGAGAAVARGVGELVGVHMAVGDGDGSGLDVGAGVAPVASGPWVLVGNTGVAAMPLGVGVCLGLGVGVAAVQAVVAARIASVVHRVSSFSMQSCFLAVVAGSHNQGGLT